ncbi:eif2a [Symbiodinium necroappetens]|uniref:Eif2a protein n=1 Tax=Symbiodinium necroappetens TaxID=1628268 RepID=A0A812M445_9DINO|nr:eif2a [Symbiodinium necroappetens]
MTVKDLKALCKQRCLKVSGKKEDLVHRLVQVTAGLQHYSTASDRPGETATEDTSQNEVGYTQAQQELNVFSVSDLRDLCDERGLTSTGTKADLVRRLTVQQAQETDREESRNAQMQPLQSGRQQLKSPEDKFLQAMKSDSLDIHTLEEIFQAEMPKPGEIVTGIVTSLVEWGAFVELERTGWSGLIHISELSDVFVDNIEDYIQPGQRVEALVIERPGDRLDRLSLSIRRLKEIKKYDPDILAAVGPLAPTARPGVVREEEFSQLQDRVAALEAIIVEMGHGQALRDARYESSKSNRKPAVAPLAEMLQGTDTETETPKSQGVHREKAQIDSILESILAGSQDLDGEDLPSETFANSTVSEKDRLKWDVFLMVPMVAEQRSLAGCLTEIFRGELHLIPFDNVERSAVAVAIRPLLLRLREAEAAELPDAWRAFDAATMMLADLTALEDWGGEVLSETLRAAAVQILSARHDVLEAVVDTHLSRLARFRSDPHACCMEQHLMTWRLLERSWHSNFAGLVKGFQQDSVQAHARSCHETLQGLANGAPVEVWVSRFARCVDIELAIDSCLPSYASLATSCATTWLNHSLPLLPWILAFLISPTKQLDLIVLQRLRNALEVCKDSQALAHMRDALVNACALLCGAAWLQMEPVSWLTSLLHAIHEACQVVLPEISPGSLAAAMAVSFAPALGESKEHPPPSPPPWKVLGIDSPVGALDISDLRPALPLPGTSQNDKAHLAESIGRALHGEVKGCTAAGGIWPGKIGPLLLLFRLLPDAGGAPLLWQARLMSLRALWGFRVQDSEEIHLEYRLLDFFRNECGHGHSLLRHVAEILRESSSNDSGEVFKATTLNMAAASSLNFNSISMLSLSESPPELFSASLPIVEARSRWAESYLSRYPNRKLRWRVWGAAKVLWSHARGQTLLTTTELQAHILLALGQGEGFSRKDFEEAALTWSQADSHDQDLKLQAWRLALAQLSAPEGPVELDGSERLRVRPSCGRSALDLTEVPAFCTENHRQEPSSPSRDARAPIIDAALVRILKSCHVLSADEVLAKLAAYPESLALPEKLPSTAFSTARMAAQDAAESFGRLSSLCDRGILRMERLDGETTGERTRVQNGWGPGSSLCGTGVLHVCL